MLHYVNKNESYWDTTQISTLLKIHRSKLKRELLNMQLDSGDYLVYNNRFLLKEDTVVRLICRMAENTRVGQNPSKRDEK